jgi:hypothetical protein
MIVMPEDYYPEPGENNPPYGGCGIHNYTNESENDYCPKCWEEDRIWWAQQEIRN